MRFRWVHVALPLLASACSREPSYALVIDDAHLAPASERGEPWCADGSAPSVFVSTQGPHASSRTSLEENTLEPAWNEQVMVARRSTFAAGLEITVVGQCETGGPTFILGSTWLHPGPDAFQGVPITLRPFGKVESLELRFARATGAPLATSTGDCDVGGCYFADDGYDEGGYYDAVESSDSEDGWDDAWGDDDWDDDDWDDDDWDDSSDDYDDYDDSSDDYDDYDSGYDDSSDAGSDDGSDDW